MGKVVVYLRAADERRLEGKGHDPRTWVRSLVKEKLEHLDGKPSKEAKDG